MWPSSASGEAFCRRRWRTGYPACWRRTSMGRPGRVRAVHRIDNETSGLVVFARTGRGRAQAWAANSGRTPRIVFIWRWCAAGRRTAASSRYWCATAATAGAAARPTPQATGQRAVTHVRVVEALGDYYAGGMPIRDRADPSSPHSSRRSGDAVVRRAALRSARCTAGRCPTAAGRSARPCTRRRWASTIRRPAGAVDSPLPGDMKDMSKRLRRGGEG